MKGFSGDLDAPGVANNIAFVGAKNAGPIPLGKYAILERNTNDGFFRLDPYDRIPYNDVDERQTDAERLNKAPYRDTYSLHPGSESVACIIIPDPSKPFNNGLPFEVNLKKNFED